MNLSRLVVFVPIEDGYLAYNTLTQSVLFLDRTTQETLVNNPNLANDEILAPLIEEKFLVPETVDESELIKTWFQKNSETTDFINLTILTTYACNLACVYCVEEGVIQPIMMDSDTQDAVINWFKTQVTENQVRRVRLCFYGGEPLLNIKAIEVIAKSVCNICKLKGIEFRAELISNGVLLSKETAEKLVDYGISQVKVTIDGDKTQHNRKRPAKNRTDSYQTILDNLIDLPEAIDLIVSGNYDQENSASFPAMLDELKALELENRIKYISFKPILNTNQAQAAVAAQCASSSLAEADLSAMVSLRNEANQRGFNVPDYLVLGPCEFNEQKSLVIDPVGNFYKCAGFVGRPEFCIGNIETGFNEKYTQFVKVYLPENCITCRYVPICGGGCRYCAQIKYGDYRKVACEEPYFETVGLEVLKSDYSPTLKTVGSRQ
ncbi:MAG: radical SAM protein [bacterium]|nr:radical SAM protein [bacterium]